MSDYGDFCREQREWRQRLRVHWHECPHCAVRFGTGTKVPPGGKCIHDGWVAPGDSGDDVKAARRIEREIQHDKENIARKKEAVKLSRTCRVCGKLFGSKRGRLDHERAKHSKHKMWTHF